MAIGGARNANKRRRKVVITRNPRKHEGLRIKNAVKNPVVKEAYDRDLSLKENLKRLGIDGNPNSLHEIRPPANKNAAFMGFASLGEISMETVDSNPKRRQISDWDAKFCKACIAAHGDNYKAMERDIVTNMRQLSETQIRKLCTKYLESLQEDE